MRKILLLSLLLVMFMFLISCTPSEEAVAGEAIRLAKQQNCGNSKLDVGEQCDDGNKISGDGCSSICQVESSWTCTAPITKLQTDRFGKVTTVKVPSKCTQLPCGNSILESGEKCDDKNTASGDGCSSTCQVESSWTCTAPSTKQQTDRFGKVTTVKVPSKCTQVVLSLCGNAVLESGEKCDDGNTANLDGCSATCQVEPSKTCLQQRSYYCSGNSLITEITNTDCTKMTTPKVCPSDTVCSGKACVSTCVPQGSSPCFFKDDQTIQTILQGQSLDVSQFKLMTQLSSNNYINKSSFAYKLFAAFHMLGYSPNTGTGDDGLPYTKKHLTLLHKFQQKNGFPVSNLLTKEVVQKMGEQLVLREQKLQKYRQDFPLYAHIADLLPNEVSKDHAAMIFTLPIQLLPEKFQVISEEEFLHCLSAQCYGYSGLKPLNPNEKILIGGSAFNKVNVTVDYIFGPGHFNPLITFSSIPNPSVNMETVLHEYAHRLDGLEENISPSYRYKSRMINTTGFYSIINSIGDCEQLIEDLGSNQYILSANFLTRYGYLSAVDKCEKANELDVSVSENVREKVKKHRGTEGFADAFGAYVLSGKRFRAVAATNSFIAQQYDWLKNLFDGVEYDTNLNRGETSGCYDSTVKSPPGVFPATQPGYFSCSEDYVWDGEELKKCAGICPQ